MPSHRNRNSRYFRELNVRRHPVAEARGEVVGPDSIAGRPEAPLVDSGDELARMPPRPSSSGRSESVAPLVVSAIGC